VVLARVVCQVITRRLEIVSLAILWYSVPLSLLVPRRAIHNVPFVILVIMFQMVLLIGACPVLAVQVLTSATTAMALRHQTHLPVLVAHVLLVST